MKTQARCWQLAETPSSTSQSFFLAARQSACSAQALTRAHVRYPVREMWYALAESAAPKPLHRKDRVRRATPDRIRPFAPEESRLPRQQPALRSLPVAQ